MPTLELGDDVIEVELGAGESALQVLGVIGIPAQLLIHRALAGAVGDAATARRVYERARDAFDLRDRGYLVREGESGYDFESFGKGAMRRLVSIVYEGGESTLEKLARLSAKADKDGKDLVLAVIDRRTDIVYYTLNPETFQGQ